MGKIWLHDFSTFLSTRVQLKYYPGWELRSRSSGGFEDVRAVGTHHDASPEGTSTKNRLEYAYKIAANKPIGNIWVHKDATVTIGAAGASNTQGVSERAHVTSKGLIPISQGNLYMVSIEAENNGIGELWPKQQTDTYLEVCGSLCEFFGLNPLTDIFSHHRYTQRKIDPAGPTEDRDWSKGGSWDDSKFNQDVLNRKKKKLRAIAPIRVFDSRNGGAGVCQDGKPVLIPVGNNVVPEGTQLVFANITVTGASSQGWLENNPGTSCVNVMPGIVQANCLPLSCMGGFYLTPRATSTHIIVDIYAYEEA